MKLSRSLFWDDGQKRIARVSFSIVGGTQPFGRRFGAIRSIDESKTEPVTDKKKEEQTSISTDSRVEGNGAAIKEEYPSGELEYQERGGWDGFVTKCRMLIALPWQRVKKGSVLKLKLAGSVREKSL
jgi:protease-4